MNPRRYVARRTDGQQLVIETPLGQVIVTQRKGWELQIDYPEGIKVQRVEERKTA